MAKQPVEVADRSHFGGHWFGNLLVHRPKAESRIDIVARFCPPASQQEVWPPTTRRALETRKPIAAAARQAEVWRAAPSKLSLRPPGDILPTSVLCIDGGQ
ncbi:unnamed protein product [Symbiodinium microadriaticum]|nr:unnamed protein product [Symbiodinium microadriaticum]